MKKIWRFIIITCMASWIAAGILSLFDVKVGSIPYNIFASFYMLIPAIVALLLQKYVNKEKIKKPLFISFRVNRWFFVALFIPLFIVFLSIGISLLLPGISFSATGQGIFDRFSSALSPDDFDMMKEQMAAYSSFTFALMMTAQGLLAACTINALFALGEELGWRGYMLRHLSHLSFMKVSLFTGVMWGLWHFPLILMGHNYPDHPVAGVFMMIVFCVLFSPLMTYVVIKSKSVISAAVFHGSINAFAGFSTVYLVGGNDLSMGLTGYMGFITIAIVTLGFYIFDKYITKENIFSNPVKVSLGEEKSR